MVPVVYEERLPHGKLAGDDLLPFANMEWANPRGP